jgi:predicted transcriptional regulator
MSARRPRPMSDPDERPGEGPVPAVYGAPPAGPLGTRRSPIDLYAELLQVLRRSSVPCRVTRLSYAVGMPVDRTHRALAFLVRLGLATRAGDENPAWRLSRRGFEFLETYWKLRSYLGPVDGFFE